MNTNQQLPQSELNVEQMKEGRALINRSYDEAIAYAKDGYLIAEGEWHEKYKGNVFAFWRPEDKIPVSMIQNIKSLPTSVKEFYAKSGNPEENLPVEFSGYLAKKEYNNNITNAYNPAELARQSDTWVIYV